MAVVTGTAVTDGSSASLNGASAGSGSEPAVGPEVHSIPTTSVSAAPNRASVPTASVGSPDPVRPATEDEGLRDIKRYLRDSNRDVPQPTMLPEREKDRKPL